MQNKHSAEYWIERLALLPHPEGGYYKEIFRSQNSVLRQPENKSYSAGTDIYFLLGSPAQGQFSAWHYLKDIEEAWHHHAGADVLIYWLDAKAQLQKRLLGASEAAALQIHIPANTWFAAVVADSAPECYALLSCACFPGFDFANFKLAERASLIEQFPQHQEMITRYTREAE